MTEQKEKYDTQDSNGNGIKDKNDAILRYVAGYLLLAFAVAGFFVNDMDSMTIITCVTFGSVLIGEQKAGSIIQAIKKN